LKKNRPSSPFRKHPCGREALKKEQSLAWYATCATASPLYPYAMAASRQASQPDVSGTRPTSHVAPAVSA